MVANVSSLYQIKRKPLKSTTYDTGKRIWNAKIYAGMHLSAYIIGIAFLNAARGTLVFVISATTSMNYYKSINIR